MFLVQRSVYKDLVCLLRDNEYLTLEELKEKVGGLKIYCLNVMLLKSSQNH